MVAGTMDRQHYLSAPEMQQLEHSNWPSEMEKNFLSITKMVSFDWPHFSANVIAGPN